MTDVKIPAHRRAVFTRSGEGTTIDPGTPKPKATPAPASVAKPESFKVEGPTGKNRAGF